MTRKTFEILSGAILAFALVALVPSARADELNQATQLTFNQPVALPGNVVLPTGTYWFVLADPMTAPSVVQVFDVNRMHLVTTFMAIPTIRTTSTNHSQLTIAEQSRKQPIALLDWYYPGRMTGHELLYSPRTEARLSEEPQITLQAKPAPQING